MHITIDTNNITNEDRAILKLVLDQYDTFASDQAAVIQEHRERVAEQEKPKRSRRTNAEIAFDAAKEEWDSNRNVDGDSYKALADAYNALIAKDPENERIRNFALPAVTDEPTSDSEDAVSETPSATEPDTADSISIEEVTELATQLIRKNRPVMVELLEMFGARKVSDVPESDWGKFASEIRAKLA